MSGMHPVSTRLPSILALAAGLALAMPSAKSQDRGTVTIYHCADEDGRPVVRDSPCAAGQAQRRVSTMQRPVDPPPRPEPPREPRAAATPPPEATPPQAARTIVVRTPTPMYECTTPDGSTYTSDDGSGNPRWVPLWTLGHGYGYGYDGPRRHLPPPRQRPPIGAPVRPAAAGTATGGGLRFDGVGRPPPRLPADQPRDPPRDPPRTPPGTPGRGHVPYAAGGTWIQDQCRPLAQAEVCQVLRDRSWTLRQRFNHALQGEQREITAERARIAQRLASDC